MSDWQSIPLECLFLVCSFLDVHSCSSIRLIHPDWNKYLTEEDSHFSLYYVTQYKTILIQRKQRLQSHKAQGHKLLTVNEQLRTIDLRDKKYRKLCLKRSVLLSKLQYLYNEEIDRFRVQDKIKTLVLSVTYPYGSPPLKNMEILLEYLNVSTKEYIQKCEPFLLELIAFRNNTDVVMFKRKLLGNAFRSMIGTILHYLNWKLNAGISSRIAYSELVKYEKYNELQTFIRNFLISICNLIFNRKDIDYLRKYIKIYASFILYSNDVKLAIYFKELGMIHDYLYVDFSGVLSPDVLDYIRTTYPHYPLHGCSISIHNPCETIKKIIEWKQSALIQSDLLPENFLDTVLSRKILSPDKVDLIEYLFTLNITFAITNFALVSFIAMNNQEILDLLIQNENKLTEQGKVTLHKIKYIYESSKNS
jgi:hypothetical protein